MRHIVLFFVLLLAASAFGQATTQPADLSKIITSIPAKMKPAFSETERQADARAEWVKANLIGKSVYYVGIFERDTIGVIRLKATVPSILGKGDFFVESKADWPSKIYAGDTVKISGTISGIIYSVKTPKGAECPMWVTVTLEDAKIESVTTPKSLNKQR
jgi:hypothetical protein